MLDPKFFENLSKNLVGLIPEGMLKTHEDLQQNFKNLMQSSFQKLDLVSREEFDVQVQVLRRTREKLEALEKKLEQTEQ